MIPLRTLVRIRITSCRPALVFLASLMLLAAALPPGMARDVSPWDSFNGVAFVPPNIWYVVGASGAFLTSMDGGRGWERRQLAQRGPGSWFDLFSVDFARDGRSGWISGERGVILHSTDAGKNWERQETGVVENLLRVAALDAQRACALGTNGTILTTADGGKTWRSQQLKGGLTLFDVTFVDDGNGWAVGEFQTILHTANAGKTWEVQSGGTRGDFESSAYFGVRFFDRQHGWVTAQGGVALWTSDGGKTWTKVALRSESAIFGIAETRSAAGGLPTELWMAGEHGTLVRVPLLEGLPSTSSSPALYHPTFYSLTDLAFSGRVGVAVGIEGTILRTDDGGRNWEQTKQ